jgi:hypothetical protein
MPAPAMALRVTDARAKEIVDAERAAIGAPTLAGIDAERSAGCRAHNDYLAAHPEQYAVTAHDENPAQAGYSAIGRLAAQTSQLTPSDNAWTAKGDPFAEGAPWHEMGLLDPQGGTGFWRGASSGKDCIGVGATSAWGPAAPLADSALLAWPGQDGIVPAWTVTYEGPYSPNRFVGVADDARTGPWLMVFSPLLAASYFPESSCTARVKFSYQLTGPAGRVALRAVTNESRGPNGETPFLSGGALLVAPTPLAVNATYALELHVSRPERSCTYGGYSTEQAAVADTSLVRGFSTVEPTTVRADFTVEIRGLTVTLDAGPSSSTGSPISDFEWDDDGNGTIDARGRIHTVTYPDSGAYTVGLTATTADGHSAGATVRFAVERPSPDTTPTDGKSRPLTRTTAVSRARRYAHNVLSALSPNVACSRVTFSAFRCVIRWRTRKHGRRIVSVRVSRNSGRLSVRRL